MDWNASLTRSVKGLDVNVKRIRKFSLLLVTILTLGSYACTASVVNPTVLPTLSISIQSTTIPTSVLPPTLSTNTDTASPPTSTPIFRQNTVPSPTDIQLPFNPNIRSDDYCKPPYAILPVSDGNDISEDEIVYELVKIWLRRYNQPNTPAFCKIDDYTIDQVYDDPSIYSQVLEPRGDFMRVIAFSVKLTQMPSDWMSFAGELDQENWLHLHHIVAITKTSEGYKLEFAYP